MFAWFLILITLPFAWFAFSRAYNMISSHSWPTVSAEVLSSSIYQRTGKRRDWCLKVSYRYTAQGRAYTSERTGVSIVGDAGCDFDKSLMQQWQAALAPGSAVVAYYNPADPAHSAIRLAGLDFGGYVLCAVPLVLFGVAASALRRARKLKPL